MKKILLSLFLTASFGFSFAVTMACDGNALSGTVASKLSYQDGKDLKGVDLSHTHFTLLADDGSKYDVAIDNVYSADYDNSNHSVPASFASNLTQGTHVDLCGDIYPDGTGIHWVHSNCGQGSHANGWVMVNGQDLTDSSEYCNLWSN